jgi:hypothetical protein
VVEPTGDPENDPNLTRSTPAARAGSPPTVRTRATIQFVNAIDLPPTHPYLAPSKRFDSRR